MDRYPLFRSQDEERIGDFPEGMYYADASGCLVWLDNAYGGDGWDRTLSSIEEVNKLFKIDRSGVSIFAEYMINNGITDISLSGDEAFEWMGKLIAIEKAPWFNVDAARGCNSG